MPTVPVLHENLKKGELCCMSVSLYGVVLSDSRIATPPFCFENGEAEVVYSNNLPLL